MSGNAQTEAGEAQVRLKPDTTFSRKPIEHRYGRACRSRIPAVADLSNRNDGCSRSSCVEHSIAQLILTMSNGEVGGPHARHLHIA
jgi:hypothetical protein